MFGQSLLSGAFGSALDPGEHFNTVLYTGASPGTQSVNTVGFQPDLVWVKGRDESYNHVLSDSIRGASQRINSNTTSAESNWSPNGISAFNATGFDVTAPGNQGYGVNQNGINYVGWSWKAGGAPPRAGVFSGACGGTTSSYITLSNAIIGTATSDLTISFWMKGVTNGEHMCVSAMAGYYSKFNIMTAPSSHAGKIRLNFGNGSNAEISIYGTDAGWTDGNWHHLAFTMDWNGSSFDIKLYKDGVSDTLTASDTSAVTVGWLNSNVALGGFVNNGTAYGCYNGELDQVRFYDSVLSASDVTALYNETFADSSNINFPTGKTAKALYRLSGNANDETGSYDGTASNVQFEAGGIFIGDFLNNNGTIPSIVSANQDAGFSIVEYTGTSASSQSVGHGLSAAPELVFIKNLSGTDGWIVWYPSAGTDGWLELNSSNGSQTGATWGGVPTSTLIHLQNGPSARSSGNGNSYIAYCWHSVAGFSKIGTYSGNGSSGGQTITGLGFNPRFLIVKNTTSSAAWRLTDSAIGNNTYLYPSLLNAEDSSSGYISLITDGFRMNGLDSNTSDTFIYLAFA